MTQIEAVARGKPEPVISGPSQVDGIARFALRAKYDTWLPSGASDSR